MAPQEITEQPDEKTPAPADRDERVREFVQKSAAEINETLTMAQTINAKLEALARSMAQFGGIPFEDWERDK